MYYHCQDPGAMTGWVACAADGRMTPAIGKSRLLLPGWTGLMQIEGSPINETGQGLQKEMVPEVDYMRRRPRLPGADPGLIRPATPAPRGHLSGKTWGEDDREDNSPMDDKESLGAGF